MTTRLAARARIRAVLLLFFFRAAAALLLAYPVARAVAAFLPPISPLSDALLFAPGALYAAEALRLGGRAIQASLEGSVLGFILVAIALSFPFAAALAALAHPEEPLPSLAKRGAAATPSLVAIGGATAFAQAVALAAITFAVEGLSGSFDSVLDERRSDLIVAGFALVTSSSVAVLGLAADLARAVVVRRGVRAVRALAVAFAELGRAPLAVFMGWAPAAAGSIALVSGAAWAASALDVSRPGAGRVWAVLIVHQLVVLGIVALRVYWLERALGIVGPGPIAGGALPVTGPPRASLDDTPARSDARDDPTPDPAA
ncbi:MAG TPA: hypothetical protein VHC69_10585 [Polyangiaceae bacterium]|nr:hypothetical protein [Polyangiaceae bacterium]